MLMQEDHECNPRIKNTGSFRSNGADCERVALAGATGQGPQDAGGAFRLVWQESTAYTTAPLAAVPAKMASSPMAKRAMNQTKPVALAGGSQKAAMTAKKPITAPQPVQHTTCSQYVVPVRSSESLLGRCTNTGADCREGWEGGRGGAKELLCRSLSLKVRIFFAGQHNGRYGCIQLTQHGLISEEADAACFLPVLLC